jgi:hypothetical protein
VIETSWWWRRVAVFGVLVCCAWHLTYLLVAGVDTELTRTIANGELLLVGATVASYIGGAAYDDRNRMIHGRMDGAPYGGSQAPPPYRPPPMSPASAAPPSGPAPYIDDGQH